MAVLTSVQWCGAMDDVAHEDDGYRSSEDEVRTRRWEGTGRGNGADGTDGRPNLAGFRSQQGTCGRGGGAGNHEEDQAKSQHGRAAEVRNPSPSKMKIEMDDFVRIRSKTDRFTQAEAHLGHEEPDHWGRA